MDTSPLSSFQAHLRTQTFPIRKPVQILRPPSVFLELPAEIRLIIYGYSFSGSATLKKRMALPVTCKKIYDECYEMAFSSTIMFHSTTHFVNFWRRTEPSRRKHIQNIEIEIHKAVQMHRVPRELQRRCAGLEDECEGLRLRSLILVINTWLDPLEEEMHSNWGVVGMTIALRCIEGIDVVGVVDRHGRNKIPTAAFWRKVSWEAREGWVSVQSMNDSSEAHSGCFCTRESLREDEQLIKEVACCLDRC